MKAIVLSHYGAPESLKLEDVPTPAPGDRELLVRVHASSINDWDWSLVKGSPFYIRLICGLLKPKIRIPGTEYAGEVVSVGNSVDGFKKGDAVYGDVSECGFGAYAEYICVPETAATRKPDSMPFAEAAAIPHAATLALQALETFAQANENTSLLVNGAGGGVGPLALQLAQAKGLRKITGVDHTLKQDFLKSLGYSQRIDYTHNDFTQEKDNYDLIIDAKSTRSPFANAKALKPHGCYVMLGGHMTRIIQTLALAPWIKRRQQKNLHILALKTNQDLERINQLYENGQLKPHIDSVFPLSETATALQHFGHSLHQGKVILNLQ